MRKEIVMRKDGQGTFSIYVVERSQVSSIEAEPPRRLIQLYMRFVNLRDTAIRDESLRAVNRSRSNSQTHSYTHQSWIRGDDVRGTRDERLSGQRSAKDGRLDN